MIDNSIYMTNNEIGTVINNVHQIKEKAVKNITFNCFTAANCFKGRTDDLKKIKKYIKSNQIVVIYGAPGIGKTETACRFSIQNLDYFDGNIIWIFAETTENLKKSFRDLSETLNLKVTDKDDVNVSLVYSRFKQSKSLFIFDNVENITDVSKYLPCKELHPTIRVIITSQICPSDSSVAKVALEALDRKDALQILKDKLGDEFAKHPIEIWEDLVKYLEGIPLSTQVVAALINKELAKPVRISGFHLENFINDLKRTFINFKIADSEIINYNKSVFNSIRFALGRLEKECTDVTLDLLRFIAYLDADRIYHSNLLSVPSINKSEERLEDALNKLAQYSLIQVEQHVGKLKIKVHRTIQLVSRKFDLNERNGTMFIILMKIVSSILDEQNENFTKTSIFYYFQSIFEHVKEEEYKSKSLEFYYENKVLAGSALCTLTITHCDELLQELLPKFKDEFMKTGNYNKTLNKMLMHATKNKNHNLATIDVLIKNGAKINLTPNESNGFHFASSWLSVELFDRLLQSNESKEMLNSKDELGRTILHILASKCNEENIEKTMKCMDHLISKWNADIFIRAEHGLTILHTTCENRGIYLKFIKYLVEKHNSKDLVNTQCDEGRTPLQYLFENCHDILHNPKRKQHVFEILTYLITECEADISIQDNKKWNTLFYVCRCGNAEMIEFVLTTRDCCDLINIQDNNGDVAFTQLLGNYKIKQKETIKIWKLFIQYEMDFSETLVEYVEEMGRKKLSKKMKNHLKKEKLRPGISSKIACNLL